MASAQKKEVALEIRGPERAFQYDRDTIIVYTGMHPDDVRPFIRIGAGDSTPAGLVSHIENVVLPDTDPINVGLELYWLHTTLERGGDVIRYVGSRDQVNRLYSYSGMREIEEDGKEETHVETLAYKLLPASRRQAKDRCLINFFETGNVNVSVDGARVLDLQNRKKSFLNLDREYELIAKALRRREERCSGGYTFLALPGTRANGVPMFWGFGQAGLLLNPPRDGHYRLFEETIRPDRVSMCIAASAYQPGFTEAIRRRNALGQGVGVFALNSDKLGDLKRIYAKAGLRVFEDSASLPEAREVSFFASRSGSHGLFTLPGGGGAERQVQVLFPIAAAAKQSRSFDYLRGPHDLEIARLQTEDEWKGEWQSRLVLVDSGGVDSKRFQRWRLRPGVYPLLTSIEHEVRYADQPAELVETFLDAVGGTEHQEPLRELLLMTLGLEYVPEKVEAILRELARAKPDANPGVRQNVYETLRLLAELPQYASFDDDLNRAVERALKQWSPELLRVGEWLSLEQSPVRIVIVVLASRRTYQLVQPAAKQVVRFEMPPSLDDLETDPKGYRRTLTRWSKVVSRADDAAGYDESIDFLERVYEERLRLLEERTRLKTLVGRLGMSWQPAQREDASRLPGWLQRLLAGVRGAYESSVDWVLGLWNRYR